MKFTLAAAFLAVAPLVAAHGTVSGIVLNGKTYSAPEAAQGKPFWSSETPVRQLAALEPMSNFSSSDAVCGRGAADSAKLIAPVTAGSKVSFKMRGGSGAPWPHLWGPVLGYLGKCSGSASDCNASNLRFFKIDQLGLKPSGNNQWWQSDLNKGEYVTLSIPKNIANGDYLLRLEIIALHNAMNVGGAETTVSCTQIRVSGGNGGTPSNDQTIKFPTTYKSGILIDIWNGFKTYAFPGPRVFTGGNAAPATSKPTASASVPINVAPAPSATNGSPSTAPAPKPTKVCRRSRSRRASSRAIVIDGADMHRRSLHRGGLNRYASLH